MAQVFHKVASNHQKWAFQNEKEGENVVVLRRQAIKKKIGIIIEKKFNYLSKKWELVTSIKGTSGGLKCTIPILLETYNF